MNGNSAWRTGDPSDFGSYLAQEDNGVISVCQWFPQERVWRWGGDVMRRPVVAWMPLPRRYEEQVVSLHGEGVGVAREDQPRTRDR